MKKIKKIAVLTGGGDCPGLNAVIRGIVKTAITKYGCEVTGFLDGYNGLVNNRCVNLSLKDVSGILLKGGTILGTTNKDNPFKYPVQNKNKIFYRDVSDKAVGNLKKNKVDVLVTIGGDGTQASAYLFSKKGVRVIGIPKTIDNDLSGTDMTFGFDSLV